MHWLGALCAVAVYAPLGCAEYVPSQDPGDDVAGLQADAGASGRLAVGGSFGVGNGGRSDNGSGVAGAAVATAGGASGGSYSGVSGSYSGVSGGSPTTGHAGSGSSTGAAGARAAGSGGAATTGASGAPAMGGQGNLGGASNFAGSGNSNTAGSPGSAGSGTTAAVELAHGKPATASSEQVGNEAPLGNDASSTTRWCAANGTYPQWWRVDLGASHRLNDFSVTFEKTEPKYSYKIETSNDGAVYTAQSTISGAGVPQSNKFASGVSARYVRITITAADPWSNGSGSHPTWASFWDFKVTGW